MAGQYRFKDSNGNIVAQISASADGVISFSGSQVNFSQANSISLGNVQLAGTASNALLLDGFDSQAFAFTSSIHPFTASIAGTNTFTSSTNARLNSIETISASNINRLNAVEIVSASNIARLSALETTSASVDNTNTTQNTRLTNLENKTGSLATTGSNTFVGTQVITGSLYVTTDLIVQGSSSIQNITGSSVNIGTNKVILNTANPAVRYGGISVIDSGSAAGKSGSLYFDSTDNEWIFVHAGNTAVTSSTVITGPETYDNLGNETHLTDNKIPKMTNGFHIVDSNISDNGTTVTINSVTSSFSGLVGIGVTSPSNLLHLIGNIATPSLRLGSTSLTYYWDIGRENATTGDFVFNNASNNSPTEKFRITAAEGNILVSSGATIYNSSGALYMRAGTSGDLILGAGGTNGYMRIGSTGNVGIGTTNAQYKYHQYGGKFILNSSDGSYGQMQIGNTASGGEATIIFVGGAASFGSVATSGDGSSAVWAIGSSVYGNGVTKFGIANVGYGNNIITVMSNGNVGIGVTTPVGQLSLKNQIAYGDNSGSPYSSYSATTGQPGQAFFNAYYASSTDGVGPYPRFLDIVSTGSPDGSNGGSNIRFFTNTVSTNSAAVERMRVRSDGRVFVGGTTIPNSPLFSVIGSGVWDAGCIGLSNTGAGGQTYTIFSTNNQFGQGGNALLFYNTTNATNNLIMYSNGNYDFLGSDVSDIRLKQDIENLNYGLDNIMLLSPKSYYLKSEDNLQGDNQTTLRKRYGFIAQEVQSILPDTITGEETETDYLGLDYNGILAVAVKAIQELKQENNNLKQRIESLETK